MHEHSCYSDGDPDMRSRATTSAPAAPATTPDSGTGDTGVKLDFMFSSEHSDNEKLPITTSADCVDPARLARRA